MVGGGGGAAYQYPIDKVEGDSRLRAQFTVSTMTGAISFVADMLVDSRSSQIGISSTSSKNN